MPSKWQSKRRCRHVPGRSVPEVADRPEAAVTPPKIIASKRLFILCVRLGKPPAEACALSNNNSAMY
jgi:hypothetical protein